MDSVGKILQEQRLAKRLTQEEIHIKTRIPLRFLKALEEDDRSAFPADVYYLGTLRTYARFLGLDASSLVLQFRASITAPEKPLDTNPPQYPVRDKTVQKKAIIAGIVIFVGLVSAVSIAVHNYFFQTAPAAVVLPVVPQPVVFSGLVLEIAAVKNTWIKVVADDITAYEATMAEGGQKVWNAKNTYRVVIGYGPGVRVKVNGEQVRLSTASSDITELIITKDGIKIGKIQSNRKPDVRFAAFPALPSKNARKPARYAPKQPAATPSVIISSPAAPAKQKYE